MDGFLKIPKQDSIFKVRVSFGPIFYLGCYCTGDCCSIENQCTHSYVKQHANLSPSIDMTSISVILLSNLDPYDMRDAVHN